MFASREQRPGRAGIVDIAFTDRHGGVSAAPYNSLDLSRSRPGREPALRTNLDLVAAAFDVAGFVTMRQVQGADVTTVSDASQHPTCDGLVTAVPETALCVRVGDCVPVVLADADAGVVAVAHAGRPGLVAAVVPATIAAMRAEGAADISAWIGPHVCGGCYEVPAAMREQVTEVVPAAFACTTWGTPSVDLGAGVTAQLVAEGCSVLDRSACTLENLDFFSYRRDGTGSGRFAGLVVLRPCTDD